MPRGTLWTSADNAVICQCVSEVLVERNGVTQYNWAAAENLLSKGIECGRFALSRPIPSQRFKGKFIQNVYFKVQRNKTVTVQHYRPKPTINNGKYRYCRSVMVPTQVLHIQCNFIIIRLLATAKTMRRRTVALFANAQSACTERALKERSRSGMIHNSCIVTEGRVSCYYETVMDPTHSDKFVRVRARCKCIVNGRKVKLGNFATFLQYPIFRRRYSCNGFAKLGSEQKPVDLL